MNVTIKTAAEQDKMRVAGAAGGGRPGYDRRAHRAGRQYGGAGPDLPPAIITETQNGDSSAA